MGREKAMLEIAGEPQIVRTARLVEAVVGTAAIVGPRQEFSQFGWECLEDDWPGAGPLGAIATVLRATSADCNLIVACDLPYLTKEWLKYLKERGQSSAADAVVPESERGAEPLCAVYRKRGEQAIWDALESGVRKVTEGLARIRVERIEPWEWKPFDSEERLLKNMNFPDDYEEAKARLGGQKSS